jgi:hypothetical protein
MAAKAWRGCLEPDDAAFLAYRRAIRLCSQKTLVEFAGNAQQSWATEPSKRHRQQETSGGIEHLPLDLTLHVREASRGVFDSGIDSKRIVNFKNR